jgi:hypothetical protein
MNIIKRFIKWWNDYWDDYEEWFSTLTPEEQVLVARQLYEIHNRGI